MSNLDIAILDDMFPQPISGFRLAEYNEILRAFPNSMVYSSGASFGAVREFRSFNEVVREYEDKYPDLRGRVKHVSNNDSVLKPRLVYSIFINNACYCRQLAEHYGASLVFTLYPGGGLHINDPDCDYKMKIVTSSPSFKKVITTQTISQEYALKYCHSNKTEFIYGGVANNLNLGVSRSYFGESETLNICFVAAKYGPHAGDKGYKKFINIAHRLADLPNVRFHVAGGYGPHDADLSGIFHKFNFYGYLNMDSLSKLYLGMDLIVSLNENNKISGAFDGFPTGCVVEAALSGCLPFCSDTLKLNSGFFNEEELIIFNDVESTASKIRYLYENPLEIKRMANNSRDRFQYLYGREYQIDRRLKVFQEILDENTIS